MRHYRCHSLDRDISNKPVQVNYREICIIQLGESNTNINEYMHMNRYV